MQWCAIVAAVGFAPAASESRPRLRRYLTDAVFPVYIVHQTLIIVLTQALAPLRWPAAIEGPVLAIATLALSFATFEIVRRVRVLRPWFGLPPLPGTPGSSRPREMAAAIPDPRS